MRMRSHPVGLDVCILVGPFVYFPTLCVQTAKALASLRGCAGSPEPSHPRSFARVFAGCLCDTIISCAGSYNELLLHKYRCWLVLTASL